MHIMNEFTKEFNRNFNKNVQKASKLSPALKHQSFIFHFQLKKEEKLSLSRYLS